MTGWETLAETPKQKPRTKSVSAFAEKNQKIIIYTILKFGQFSEVKVLLSNRKQEL